MCKFPCKYHKVTRATILLILAMAFTPQMLLAQHASDKGWFEADYVIGCEGLFITITHTRPGAGTLFFSFQGNPDDPIRSFLDGSFNEGETASALYGAEGTYYIVVIDQSGSGTAEERTDILEVTILPPAAPNVTIATCQGNLVRLTFDKDSDPFDSYMIDFGDGGDAITADGEAPFDYVYNFPGSYEITVQGQFTRGNGNSCETQTFIVSTVQEDPNPTLNSITVLEDNSIRLRYESLKPNFQYTVYLDRGNGFQNLTGLDNTAHIDEVTITNPTFSTRTEFYAFKIVAQDFCQSITEESEVGYSIAFDISNETVNENYSVDILWGTSNQNFSSIDLEIDGNTNQTYNTASNTTGETITFNNCTDFGEFTMTSTINGIISTSQSIVPFSINPPILPATDAPEAEVVGATVDIVFDIPQLPVGEYILFRKDLTDDFREVMTSINNQTTDTTIPSGTGRVCYRATYVDECGNTSELSDETCIILSTSLGIPTAFSPNNDGQNDIFKIADGIYNNFSMSIYNRWGSLIYNTINSTEGWNGTFNGEPAASGTYLFKISFQNADNLLITRTGSFVLIR